MNRFPSPVVAIALSCAGALLISSARADTPAQIAAKENDDGKALMFERRYKEASAKFRSAAARSPDPKFYFNLCASEFQQSALRQAFAACSTAEKLNPDSVLKAKIVKLEDKIKSDAAAQRIDLTATASDVGSGAGSGSASAETTSGSAAGYGTGSGSATAGNTGPSDSGQSSSGSHEAGGSTTYGGTTTAAGGPNSPTYGQRGVPPLPTTQQGRPQTQDLFVEAKPDNTYTWTVGVDLFGGRGAVGQSNAFGNVVGGIRLRSDYLIKPRAKFGTQFYFQGTGFGSGDQSLQIYDTGAALYKHFCGGTRFCFTPLAGAHFAVMNPSNDSNSTTSQAFNYVGLGARLEGKLSYSLGKRYEHVISVAVDANWYTRALSEPMNGLPAHSWGLDEGGNVISLGFGYTYRFSTPVGAMPFLSLE